MKLHIKAKEAISKKLDEIFEIAEFYAGGVRYDNLSEVTSDFLVVAHKHLKTYCEEETIRDILYNVLHDYAMKNIEEKFEGKIKDHYDILVIKNIILDQLMGVPNTYQYYIELPSYTFRDTDFSDNDEIQLTDKIKIAKLKEDFQEDLIKSEYHFHNTLSKGPDIPRSGGVYIIFTDKGLSSSIFNDELFQYSLDRLKLILNINIFKGSFDQQNRFSPWSEGYQKSRCFHACSTSKSIRPISLPSDLAVYLMGLSFKEKEKESIYSKTKLFKKVFISFGIFESPYSQRLLSASHWLFESKIA